MRASASVDSVMAWGIIMVSCLPANFLSLWSQDAPMVRVWDWHFARRSLFSRHQGQIGCDPLSQVETQSDFFTDALSKSGQHDQGDSFST